MQDSKIADRNAELVSLVDQITHETRLLVAELQHMKEVLNEIDRRLVPLAD
jgi:uncharacterized protein (DUF849 family)